jgi:hypothetical protein
MCIDTTQFFDALAMDVAQSWLTAATNFNFNSVL